MLINTLLYIIWLFGIHYSKNTIDQTEKYYPQNKNKTKYMYYLYIGNYVMTIYKF